MRAVLRPIFRKIKTHIDERMFNLRHVTDVKPDLATPTLLDWPHHCLPTPADGAPFLGNAEGSNTITPSAPPSSWFSWAAKVANMGLWSHGTNRINFWIPAVLDRAGMRSPRRLAFESRHQDRDVLKGMPLPFGPKRLSRNGPTKRLSGGSRSLSSSGETSACPIISSNSASNRRSEALLLVKPCRKGIAMRGGVRQVVPATRESGCSSGEKSRPNNWSRPQSWRSSSRARRVDQAFTLSRQCHRPRLLDDPPRVNRTSPPTMTVWARPRTSQPPNGVLRLLERNCVGSIVQRDVGVDDRDVGVGAGAERPLGNAQKLRGVDGQLADDLGPGQMAGLDQARRR